MSHVLADFALTIAQSEFRARPDFVPFEGSPSAEDFCIAALAAALRAERRRWRSWSRTPSWGGWCGRCR